MSAIVSRIRQELSPIPDWIDNIVLDTDESAAITVPDGVRAVLLTATGGVWLRKKQERQEPL